MQYAVCYVSTLKPGVTIEDIKSLLRSSQKDNNKNGITGILLFSEGNFFQVLEGKKDVVIALFERIKQDSRHYDLISIFKKEISAPEFGNYEVEFFSGDSIYDRNELEVYLQQVKKLNPSIQTSVSYLIENFS